MIPRAVSAALAGGDERLCRLVWAYLREPDDQAAGRWIAEHGAVEALDRLSRGLLGRGQDVLQRLAALDLDAVARGHDHLGVRVLIPGDEEWPHRLDELDRPPHCLFVRGPLDLTDLGMRGIAIVGARAATPYGTQVARGMAADLAHRDVVVVSGAAFGIDAAAHEGALAAGGETLAVLACGLDRPYPLAHAGLIARVAGSGAVVSEVPLGHAPYRGRFLSRNRIIAAATLGCVVVEAGPRSGSLNTARVAEGLGRHVAMVPGPVTSMMSVGCHEWIRVRQAHLVTDAADVLDVMGPLGVFVQDLRRAPEQPEDLVADEDRTLWSAVPVRRGAGLAELVRLGGGTTSSTLAGLGRLVLAGLVERQDDTWRKVTRRG